MERKSAITTKEIAYVLLQSKGRSASVAVEEGPVMPTRLQRSVSNQIEEDAVNGLLNDLLTPMAEERHRTSTASAPAAFATPPAVAAVAKPAVGGSPVVARRLDPPKAPGDDSSDSGVSDSSDSAEEGESERSKRESSFFPDSLGSPKLGRPPQPASSPLAPPPATLEPQTSVLSWLDYLRTVCPVCEEMRDRDSGGSLCGPCGQRVCPSCVLVFKQRGVQAYVRVCRKCRPRVPLDGEMICGACCKASLEERGAETRECTECKRRTCRGCCKLYVLRTLGESEPRAVCSACVTQVQMKLSSYPKERAAAAKSSVVPAATASGAGAAAGGASNSPRSGSVPPPVERNNSGTFWKSLVSPRRGTDTSPPAPASPANAAAPPAASPPSASPPPKRIGKASSKVQIQRRGRTDDAPFPGVKLHTASDVLTGRAAALRSGEIPDSLVRRAAHAKSKVTFNDVPVVIPSPTTGRKSASTVGAADKQALPAAAAAAREPERGLVLFDFVGDAAAGQIDLTCGRAVRVYERRADGWAVGSEGVSERRGLFPLENITVDPVLVAAAAAMSGKQSGAPDQYRGSIVEVARYPTGSFVRATVGGHWTECEVLREGNSRFPYRLRTVDIAKAVIQVEESSIRPTLRRTVSDPDLKKGDRVAVQLRGVGSRDDASLPSKAEADDAEVLDSLRAKVLQMRHDRVHSGVVAARPMLANLSQSAGSLSAPLLVPPLVEDVVGEVGEEVSEAPPVAAAVSEAAATPASLHRLGKQLMQSVREKDLGRALQALDEGADPNFAANSQGPPLVLAAKLGHVKLVLLLLQRGAEVNAQTQTGWTALHFAVKQSAKELAELLRSHGARADIVNEWLKAPIDIARDKNDTEMLEVLTRKGPQLRHLSRTGASSAPAPAATVPEASIPARIAVDDMILSPARGPLLNSRPSSLQGPAAPVVVPAASVVAPSRSSTASPQQAAPIVAIASSPPPASSASPLEKKSSPRPAPPTQAPELPAVASPVLNRIPAPRQPPPTRHAVDTAVTQPFRDGPTKSVVMARPKAKQKNPNRKSKSFDLTRSLVDACSLGDLTRIKALLHQGAKVNGVDVATGNTPLIAAVLGGHNAAITLLLDRAGCNVNMPNRAGMTVLHVLAETGNEDAALWLIQRGANINAKNALGCTPLDLSPKLAEMVASGAYLAE